MDTVAVLPVKTFSEAKRRLHTGLSPGERRALAQAMFTDVLIALRRSSAVDSVLVVSADHSAQQIAGGYGAQILSDEEHGHNVAARHGVEAALRDGARRVVLVPGDCPALSPAELDGLLARDAPERSALIVPDRHGTGTNALVLTPPDVMAPSFGPGSRDRHLENAGKAGAHGEIVEVPTLALDVDTAEDLEELEHELGRTWGGAANTRGMLMQLLRSRAR
ncbi:MAG TPA: 2-phospho-L-lactate guanylyltransferase [Solirubrobacteraceae bacterium]|nr:2-phospho-L-lactate guanylyltransferase [Solirubrobacteraceae bacterium]